MSMPKEPRQLMINLMYLVLTALLALNVSSEILHAFKVINQSVTSSNAAIVDKNQQVYAAFDENQKQKGQEDRIKPYNDKAKQIKAEADKAVKLLEDWKEKVVARAGGRDKTTGEIEKEDDIDASTFLLVEQKGGDEIKKTLTDLRAKMLSVVNSDARSNLGKTLPIKVEEPAKSENNPQGNWSFGYFNNMPTVAAVTLLAKFQNDVRNSEAAILTQLMYEAGAKQIKFDEMAAIAVPKNSYVLAGQKVEANIMLAAYNKAVQPQVTTGGGGRITKVENGVAIWETIAAGAGLQTVKGSVTIDLGGVVETRPYEFQYMVGSTGASIQLDKMNVMYIGVENPVTVSAAGYSLQDVSLVMADASVVPTAGKLGHYEVRVEKPGERIAKIMAKTPTGTTEVGTMPIRVKFIPDPVAKIGGKSSGSMPTSAFRAQAGIAASLDNFDFQAKYIVQSYEFSMLPKRGDLVGPYKVSGYQLNGKNPSMDDAVKRLKPGDKIFFDEITAVGPDKRPRKLNSVILTML